MVINDDKFIVVTGGAGFIGSGVVRFLNDSGMSNIVVVDDLQHDHRWKNLQGKQFIDFIHKDKFLDWLRTNSGDVGAYIHLGACSDTTEKDANYLIENNYHYSVKLAEYAFKNDNPFIYASSAATYGDGSLGFSDDHTVLSDLKPLNIYGYSWGRLLRLHAKVPDLTTISFKRG